MLCQTSGRVVVTCQRKASSRAAQNRRPAMGSAAAAAVHTALVGPKSKGWVDLGPIQGGTEAQSQVSPYMTVRFQFCDNRTSDGVTS